MLLDDSNIAPARRVAQIAKDVNADGTVDIACKVSLASLPAGAKTLEYVIDMNYGGKPRRRPTA